MSIERDLVWNEKMNENFNWQKLKTDIDINRCKSVHKSLLEWGLDQRRWADNVNYILHIFTGTPGF